MERSERGRVRRFWMAFRDIAILFSFAVNFVLVLVLLIVTIPAIDTIFYLKTNLVEPLLYNLDTAFLGLGEATIDSKVQIDEPMPIQFNLPLDEPLPIYFDLVIEQDTNVVLQQAVPLYGMPAQFNLPAGGGMINGSVSLALPAGLQLPVHLSMVVPVSQTIPVRLNVPVSETIPIQMTVPVHIKLGESGLNPVVHELRGALQPIQVQIESLPDGIELP
jgi:hypothetical protein